MTTITKHNHFTLNDIITEITNKQIQKPDNDMIPHHKFCDSKKLVPFSEKTNDMTFIDSRIIEYNCLIENIKKNNQLIIQNCECIIQRLQNQISKSKKKHKYEDEITDLKQFIKFLELFDFVENLLSIDYYCNDNIDRWKCLSGHIIFVINNFINPIKQSPVCDQLQYSFYFLYTNVEPDHYSVSSSMKKTTYKTCVVNESLENLFNNSKNTLEINPKLIDFMIASKLITKDNNINNNTETFDDKIKNSHTVNNYVLRKLQSLTNDICDIIPSHDQIDEAIAIDNNQSKVPYNITEFAVDPTDKIVYMTESQPNNNDSFKKKTSHKLVDFFKFNKDYVIKLLFVHKKPHAKYYELKIESSSPNKIDFTITQLKSKNQKIYRFLFDVDNKYLYRNSHVISTFEDITLLYNMLTTLNEIPTSMKNCKPKYLNFDDDVNELFIDLTTQTVYTFENTDTIYTLNIHNSHDDKDTINTPEISHIENTCESLFNTLLTYYSTNNDTIKHKYILELKTIYSEFITDPIFYKENINDMKQLLERLVEKTQETKQSEQEERILKDYEMSKRLLTKY